MPIRVEAYTAGGVATGVVARPGPLREVLDGAGDIVIERSRWLPLDGSGERAGRRRLRLQVDDLFLVVADEPEGIPVHAQWHSIELDAGPYRVNGEMPTMPGFDPGRALARPTGEFVLLRDAQIRLIDREDAGEATRPGPRQPLHGRSDRRRPDARVLLSGRRDDDHRIVRRRARGRSRRVGRRRSATRLAGRLSYAGAAPPRPPGAGPPSPASRRRSRV